MSAAVGASLGKLCRDANTAEIALQEVRTLIAEGAKLSPALLLNRIQTIIDPTPRALKGEQLLDESGRSYALIRSGANGRTTVSIEDLASYTPDKRREIMGKLEKMLKKRLLAAS